MHFLNPFVISWFCQQAFAFHSWVHWFNFRGLPFAGLEFWAKSFSCLCYWLLSKVFHFPICIFHSFLRQPSVFYFSFWDWRFTPLVHSQQQFLGSFPGSSTCIRCFLLRAFWCVDGGPWLIQSFLHHHQAFLIFLSPLWMTFKEPLSFPPSHLAMDDSLFMKDSSSNLDFFSPNPLRNFLLMLGIIQEIEFLHCRCSHRLPAD